ncbi:PAS domain-containing protein [Flagellimonas taeanensis]|jgi:PAS domain S-box-containing protein|uniref:PAS domain-containing protein n=1 Tax=Flavobacteriaceae TaxID=49546 RepID=UPI000E6A095B|nr:MULTISPECIES: PAS domain-containing protein [Allomuricauda]MDC6383942.1 PAS domain-containing protein [Muricauda sp. SK9]RIV48555.1 PAS domain-containing protein [Allomuricauda taeanensis]
MNVEGKKFISPLLCFDIYSEYYRKLLEQLRKDADVRQVKSILKGKIGDSIEDLIQLETYDALVITDPYQNIVWVSDGFQEMTGYPKKHVLGKRPSFLQGPRTSKVSKQQIRNGLEQDRHFAGSILNYRKNGESYLCQIKIVPIYDSKSVLVNFLALEKELLVA